MKSSFTFLLLLLSFTGLLAQTDCTVKIVYAMNKSLPPSYTFKTDPVTDGAKYYWTFGDNTISDSPSPTHTFKISDTYQVQVKVTSTDGKICYGEAKTRYEGGTTTTTTTTILSGKGKVVDKSATSGCGLTIAMDNGTYLIPAEMATDFQVKAGQYVEFTYELLNDKPSTCPPGIMVKIQKISEILQTVCNVPISFTKNNVSPASYTFKTAEQPAGSKYSWYFGDQGNSADASPTFTFNTNGTYSVTLKVTDASGKVCSSVLRTAFEGKTSPVLSAKGKVKKLALTGCDLVITLDNGITLIPAKIIPDFVLRDGQYVELTYEKLGEKITDCKEGSEAKIITIKEIPTTTPCKAYFTAAKFNETAVKKMTFTNLSVGDLKECVWNFGDNTTSTATSSITTHEYANNGEYKVCLIITTVSGCKSDYCTTVKIGTTTTTTTTTSCSFDLIIKPKEATPNTFLFYTTSKSEIKSWSWNFGDGKTSDAQNPEHAYEKTGIYEVSCTVATLAGCTTSRTVKYSVLTSSLSTCSGAISLLLFDPTDNKCNGKAIVKLVDESAKEIAGVSYFWSDGRTGSTVENLCPDKNYTVQAVINGVCQKSTSFTMLSKPVWRASTINGQSNFTVISPKEGVNYEWNFGTGTILKGAEINYNFENDGVYNVTLKAINGSDYSEYSQQVVVLKSIAGTNIINKSELRIYPSPVQEMLKINFGNPVQGAMFLEILDITGKRAMVRQLNTEGASQVDVNVQQLRSGIYFLRMTNGKQLITDQKFIKAD